MNVKRPAVRHLKNTQDKCTHVSGGGVTDWTTVNLGTGRSVSLYLVHIRPILGSRTMSTGDMPGFCKQNKHTYKHFTQGSVLYTISVVKPGMSLSPKRIRYNQSSSVTRFVLKRVVSRESLATLKLFDVLCQVFTTRLILYPFSATIHGSMYPFRSPACWIAVHRSDTVCAIPFLTLGQ